MERQYKEYDPADLARLQRVELDILKDVRAVCEKHGLRFFFLGGTGIGAVRHKGFIPWDDDIDIAMPREDYDVLLDVFENEYPGKYRILTPLRDRDYCSNVTKIIKVGTRFVPYLSRKSKVDLGIDLDIFPLDCIPQDEKLRATQLRRTWFLNKLLFLRGCGEPIIPLKGVVKYVAAAICWLAHAFLVLFHVPPAFLYKLLEREETRYNGSDTGLYNTLRVTMSDRSYVSKEELYPLMEFAFEDTTGYLPHDYDVYLTRLFGDYMTLPPEDKRVNHCPYILDFGDED